jgi:hypothetical protein
MVALEREHQDCVPSRGCGASVGETTACAASNALDAAGRRRSPATVPSYHAGRPPRNKGQLYPADPPTVEEIIATVHARRAPMMSATAGLQL